MLFEINNYFFYVDVTHVPITISHYVKRLILNSFFKFTITCNKIATYNNIKKLLGFNRIKCV